MKRTCIICRIPKELTLFNEEHIFPAAIGGNITITNVCKKCNSELGENIDNHFLKNNGILFYRNTFGLARNERSRKNDIPNPFQGVHHDINGKPHLITFKDGKPQAQSIENMEFFETDEKGKYIGKLTIPYEKKGDANKIFEKILKRKGINFDLGEVVREEEEYSGGELNPEINMEFKTFILGCLKIGYEITANLFPSFINDIHSQRLVNYIKNPKDNESLIPLINRGSIELTDYYKKKFSNIEGLLPFHHAIIMENINNYGLICVVRVFEFVFPIIMSSNSYRLPDGKKEILIINDAKSSGFEANIAIQFVNKKFSVYLDHLSVLDRNEILRMGDKSFKTLEGLTPIYNMNKKEVFADLHNLCIYLVKTNNLQMNIEDIEMKFTLFHFEYYLKSHTNEFVRLLDLNFIKQIVLLDNY